jgi:hypothetical protein
MRASHERGVVLPSRENLRMVGYRSARIVLLAVVLTVLRCLWVGFAVHDISPGLFLFCFVFG